jgi:hypothetical protein
MAISQMGNRGADALILTAPAENAVRYGSVKYNITTEGNRFVGAGPEVDKAWREISYDSKQPGLSYFLVDDNRQPPLKIFGSDLDVVGDQWLSESDISRLGMPTSSLKVNHPRTGQPGYRVGMEVFHQLHCLNLLRRVTYKDYYEPLGGEFGHGPEALKHHTGIKLFD